MESGYPAFAMQGEKVFRYLVVGGLLFVAGVLFGYDPDARRALAVAPTADAPVFGRVDAPLLLRAFFSTRCPHCRAEWRRVGKDLLEGAKAGRIRLQFVQVPLGGIAPEDPFLYCVAGESFEAYVAEWERIAAAREKGVSPELDGACAREQGLARGRTGLARARALTQLLGVRAVPTYVLNGEVLQGALPEDALGKVRGQ